MEDKKIYSLNLAAFLIYSGCKDYSIGRDETDSKGIYYFVFRDKDVEDLIQEYRESEVVLNIKSFNRIYKRLRKEIYNKRLEESING